MITISSWNGLERFGIGMLTGEACGYGYRVLCDLNRVGVNLIAECFGVDPVKFEQSLPNSWNSKVNHSEAIRSIMIAPQMLVPLAVFACWSRNCSAAYIMYDNSVVGIESTDEPEAVKQWLGWNQGKFCEECRRYGKGGGVNYQYRNHGVKRQVHAMSGRTE